MQAWLIYNPVAGHRDVEPELLKAQEYLQAQGWQVRLCRTEGAGHAAQLSREARDAGVQVAVAVGGDGTIGQVVDGLVNSNTRLGVIPAGTGNVWARMVGIPVWGPSNRNGIVDAARVLVEGVTRRVDVGWVDGRHFLLWAGLGFDAQVAQEVEPHREVRRTLGNMTYIVAGLAQGLVMRGERTTVIVDGRIYRQRLLMLLVSNAQLYGPLLAMAPEAKLDDGLLDVYLFKGTNTFDTLRHLTSVLTGTQSMDPQIEYYQARHVSVITEHPWPVHVDGDPFGNTPVNIEVIPRSLQVIVPRWAPNDLFQEGGFESRRSPTLVGRVTAQLHSLTERWQEERRRLERRERERLAAFQAERHPPSETRAEDAASPEPRP
ncbi:MAG: diacylglycerol kinase family protein [Anaerolineales bacterium]